MPFVPVPGGMKWRNYNFPKFVGGLVDAPKSDAECLQFDNFEMMQDGFARCRLGYYPLHVAGLLGLDTVTGMRYDGYGHLLVAKAAQADTDFYCIDTSTVPFTNVTRFYAREFIRPRDCMVFFEFINTAATNYVFYGGPGTDTLRAWDYEADAATDLHVFPEVISHFCWHNGYMYLLAGNTLWFSNISDPFTWPEANNIPIAINHGIPKALKSIGDRLVIFCTNGIQYLVGEPSSSFFIGLLAPDIPFVDAVSMGCEGGNTAFLSYENVVQLTGGLQVLSANIQSLPLYLLQDCLGAPGIAVTPEYVGLRTTTKEGQAILYVYERLRHGTWSRWTYTPNSGLANQQTQLNPIAYVPCGTQPGFVLSGSDGNLYLQPFNTHYTQLRSPIGNGVTPNLDYPALPIISTVATRYTGITEDRIVQKQLRGFSLQGEGTDVSVAFNFVDELGNCTTVPFPMITQIPVNQTCQLSSAGPQAPAGTFQELQMTISGKNMTLREVALFWRPVRYSMVTNYLLRANTQEEGSDDMPIGAIIAYAGTSVPTGYKLCDGSAISRATYSSLFTAIGVTYGIGDGSTTFNLPDLRGRTGVGAGTGTGLTTRALAATFGEEAHLLTADESGVPAHTHSVTLLSQYGGSTTSGSWVPSGTCSDDSNATASPNTPKSATSAHNSMQPSLALNYIIRVVA